MSQSAASEAIQTLEHLYKVKLFDRNRNRMALTAVGQTLRKDAVNLMAECEQFESRLLGHEQIGHIRLGASFTIGNHLATRYLAKYLTDYPEANVELTTANTPEIAAKVLNYEVDIGMIESEVQHKDLALIPWREDELVIFCSSSHPLAKKKSLSKQDILQTPWILREPNSGARHQFEKAMADLIPHINIFLELGHNEAIKNAVESGLGIGCLSQIVLKRNFENGDLIPLKIPHRNMKRTFYFALPKNRTNTPATHSWMAICRSLDK